MLGLLSLFNASPIFLSSDLEAAKSNSSSAISATGLTLIATPPQNTPSAAVSCTVCDRILRCERCKHELGHSSNLAEPELSKVSAPDGSKTSERVQCHSVSSSSSGRRAGPSAYDDISGSGSIFGLDSSCTSNNNSSSSNSNNASSSSSDRKLGRASAARSGFDAQLSNNPSVLQLHLHNC